MTIACLISLLFVNDIESYIQNYHLMDNKFFKDIHSKIRIKRNKSVKHETLIIENKKLLFRILENFTKKTWKPNKQK